MNKLIVVVSAALAAFVAGAGNLILVGDSTLAPRKPEVVLGSWGDAMGESLADGWKIVNVAVGGKTVRTIQSGKVSQWQKALDAMQKGDFVIVQFGINDANKKKLVEVPEFKAEFGKFADAIRAKGATPVFCSPIASCTYRQGKFVRNASRDRYAAATKEIAAEKKVDFVDMTTLTGDELAKLDQARGEALYVGASKRDGKDIFDRTHARKSGAKVYGAAFIRDVKSRKLSIAAIFK